MPWAAGAAHGWCTRRSCSRRQSRYTFARSIFCEWATRGKRRADIQTLHGKHRGTVQKENASSIFAVLAALVLQIVPVHVHGAEISLQLEEFGLYRFASERVADPKQRSEARLELIR